MLTITRQLGGKRGALDVAFEPSSRLHSDPPLSYLSSHQVQMAIWHADPPIVNQSVILRKNQNKIKRTYINNCAISHFLEAVLVIDTSVSWPLFLLQTLLLSPTPQAAAEVS
jgi:hypothetical protein